VCGECWESVRRVRGGWEVSEEYGGCRRSLKSTGSVWEVREVLMEYWECWEYLRGVWGMSGKGWECLGSFESVFNIRYIFCVS